MSDYKNETPKLTESELKMLLNTYLMYDDNISINEIRSKDAKDEQMKKNFEITHKLLETMRQEVVDKLKTFGYTDSSIQSMIEEEKSKCPNTGKSGGVERVNIPSYDVTVIRDYDADEEVIEVAKPKRKVTKANSRKRMSKVRAEVLDNGGPDNPETVKDIRNTAPKEESTYVPDMSVDIKKAQGKSVKYDFIPLPSEGKCYRGDVKKIPVAYLTANDENMIMSPNLYQDGSFLDHLIQAKVMSNNIDTDQLIPADREAILVWLRIGGYGNMYPVTAKDNDTGKEFTVNIDLSKLKYKKFRLSPDENGHFDFTLPIGGNRIKFKYLSYADNKELTEITLKEDSALKKRKLSEIAGMIEYYTEEDCENSVSMKKKVDLVIKTLTDITDGINPEDYDAFNHLVTNRLSMSIVSVDGITDRDYIDEFVEGMSVMDAKSLREYIADNEPGFDLNVTVEKPESLGGGSMKLFLAFDQFMFLNVAK